MGLVGAGKGRSRIEARGKGDIGKGLTAFDHLAPRGVQSHRQIMHMRADADRLLKQGLQMTAGKPHPTRQAAEKQRRIDVFLHQTHRMAHPLIHHPQAAGRRHGGAVCPKPGLLVDEEAGDFERQRIALPAANDIQHQIHRRQRTAGGDALAIDHEPVADDVDLRIDRGKIVHILPVGGGGKAIEQARFRQKPGPGFDARHHAAMPRRLRKQPLQ